MAQVHRDAVALDRKPGCSLLARRTRPTGTFAFGSQLGSWPYPMAAEAWSPPRVWSHATETATTAMTTHAIASRRRRLEPGVNARLQRQSSGSSGRAQCPNPYGLLNTSRPNGASPGWAAKPRCPSPSSPGELRPTLNMSSIVRSQL